MEYLIIVVLIMAVVDCHIFEFLIFLLLVRSGAKDAEHSRGSLKIVFARALAELCLVLLITMMVPIDSA